MGFTMDLPFGNDWYDMIWLCCGGLTSHLLCSQIHVPRSLPFLESMLARLSVGLRLMTSTHHMMGEAIALWQNDATSWKKKWILHSLQFGQLENVAKNMRQEPESNHVRPTFHSNNVEIHRSSHQQPVTPTAIKHQPGHLAALLA